MAVFIMAICNILLAFLYLFCQAFQPLSTDDVGLSPTPTDRSKSVSMLRFGTKPTGSKCLNFCKIISGMCGNGGTCILHEDTCQSVCLCMPGWTGVFCKELLHTGTDSQDILGSGDGNGIKDNKNNATLVEPELRDVNIADNESVKSEGIHSVKFQQVDSVTAAKTLLNEKNVGDKAKVVTTNFAASKSNINHDKKKSRDAEVKDMLQIGENNSKDSRTKIEDTSTIPKVLAGKNGGKTKVCSPGFVCEHGYCNITVRGSGAKHHGCICDKNWVGTFCEEPCTLDCGERGHCAVDKIITDLNNMEESIICVCEWNYTGARCNETMLTSVPLDLPEENILFHWYVVGVAVTVAVIMIVVLILIPYYMWKKRLILVLKIVHYFQKYEDDDGKEYDAFVSYKSSPADEKFVLNHLYPILEEELNFKLCIHQRDFPPGETIANNIVHAIENSRRTILVLSPAYVESEWCRMEYQKAQHEMLKLKHRIIPIMFENITGIRNMDKNLRSILNSVTYVEWPGEDSDSKKYDKFWKKIRLSLPKKPASASSPLSPLSSSLSSSSYCASSLFASSSISSSNIKSSISQGVVSDFGYDSTMTISSIEVTDQKRASISTESHSSNSSLQRRKKPLRTFVQAFVKSTRLFFRQESTSSQTDLLDDETDSSRESCESLSESVSYQNSHSVCSSVFATPVSLHAVKKDSHENNCIFMEENCEDCLIKDIQMEFAIRSKCPYSTINAKMSGNDNQCLQFGLNNEMIDTETNCINQLCQTNTAHQNMGSDNQRIVVSVLEGTDMLKIKKITPFVPKENGKNLLRNHSLKEKNKEYNKYCNQLCTKGMDSSTTKTVPKFNESTNELTLIVGELPYVKECEEHVECLS
ncbi:hypothetical protein CHS0354_029533 [Potamilus streckersoni]|uniref:Uncharacterized protein n=1 Tax=Potamilus streckersoni TaxID=2493646 RepID=A0AAE0SZ05_9BIVA|nr:hypothetical protein CHS0354_029533 [Potamilus streckersoni]